MKCQELILVGSLRPRRNSFRQSGDYRGASRGDAGPMPLQRQERSVAGSTPRRGAACFIGEKIVAGRGVHVGQYPRGGGKPRYAKEIPAGMDAVGGY
jgi:hypothetical protein